MFSSMITRHRSNSTKIVSGWYFVEKSSDGQKGWIPMSFAKEIIESDHNRAKNYKKRHEFLKYLSTLDDQNNA